MYMFPWSSYSVVYTRFSASIFYDAIPPRYSASCANALYRWDILFLMSLGICAYVSVNPSGRKMGSHPKPAEPSLVAVAGTMVPGVRPTNTCIHRSVM
jgi:hypothetical protein